MDFKSLLSQLDQLNEAKEKTKTGLKHTAEPGGYGRKDDEDDEGNKVKSTAAKKGKGRPKKDADDSGETKKYDFSAFGVKSGKDVKLPKHDKKKTTVVKGKSQSHADNKKDDGTDPGEEPKTKAKKKGLKEYFDALDRAIMNEAEQIQIKPASQMPKQPGQTSMQKPAVPGQPQQVAGQPAQNTQVIAQGNRTLGTVNNPALAAQIKKELEGGGMTLMPEGEMDEGRLDELGNTDGGRKALRAVQKRGGDEITAWNKKPESGYSPTPTNAAKHFNASVSAGNRLYGHGPNTLQKDTVLARDAMRRYHKGEPITPEEVKIISKWYPGFKVEEGIAGQQGVAEGAENSEYDQLVSNVVNNDIQRRQAAGLGTPERLRGKPRADVVLKAKNLGVGLAQLIKDLDSKYQSTVKQGMAEADQPPNDSLMSPMSEARAKADNKAEKTGKKVTKDLEYDMGHKGKDDNKAKRAGKKVTKDIEYDEKKKKTVKEAAKPDFPDIDDDGNTKETISKAAQDAKKDKKKVKEGMEHKLKAARHIGKAHALSKQGYNCNYDDMEESRHYHEGFKEGLDECYGQIPIQGQGYVGETSNEVADMASYGAHTPQIADEGNAFTDKLRKTPDGGTFRMGRNTYTDRSSIEESPFAFEAWDKELNAILEGKEVTEGVTISSSTGQQGSPNSVSINATDADADSVLNMIKQLGLGGLGGQEQAAPASQAMSLAPADDGEMPAEIEVVDDHDDMLSLIRKMSGQGPAQATAQPTGDYEEEGGEPAHSHEEGPEGGAEDGAEDGVKEETCESCGSAMQEGHSCGEAVEENETIPQEEDEVAEDAAQNDGQAETTADENAEAEEDEALATVDAAQNESDEELEESLANGNDDTFEADMDFMTKVITGGANGQKRNQSVGGPMTIASTPMKESTDLLTDWRKLSGIN
jgi:hypothetical protein